MRVRVCLHSEVVARSLALSRVRARELGACACVRVCLHSEVVARVLQEPLVYLARTTLGVRLGVRLSN